MNQNTFCKYCHRIPSQCSCTHPAKELDEQFKKGFEAGKVEGWKAHKFHHPAKTLTDEEIQELALSDEFWISEDCTIFDWHKFAKAILKKAQE
jgi:hypothetical protein